MSDDEPDPAASLAADPSMATKILHTADWHLGMRFLGFGEAARTELTRQRLATVRRILGVAERYGVHAVLVAGDVFDGPEPGETWWRPLADLLQEQRWSARPLVFLPGNHDPLTATSVWRNRAFLEALPSWVHVVDRDDWSLSLGDDAVIHASPCRRAAGQLDLTSKLPAREPGDERVRIAVLHGQTTGFAGTAPHFHIAADTATRLGFDYVALGDTHALRRHPPDHAPMIYPGAPEPCRFGETEAGNVAVVLLPRRRTTPIVQIEPVGHFRWEQREVTTLEALQALHSEDHRNTVMRLVVRMRVAAAQHAIVEGLLRELESSDARGGRVGILTVDRSELMLDTRNLMLELEDLPEQVRETARRLQAIIDDGGDRERAELAERALVHLYGLAREQVATRVPSAEPSP